MKQDFWLRRWETGDIAFHRDEVNPLLRELITQSELAAGSRIFLPLCGKSQDLWWLAEQGFEVIGVELSAIACQTFFKEHQVEAKISHQGAFEVYEGPSIKLFCGDFFKLTSEMLPAIDLVFDSKAMIALPKTMRADYVARMKEILTESPAVHLLIIVFEMSFQTDNPPFPVTQDEVVSGYGPGFTVEQLARIPQQTIPSHLAKRGYQAMIETAYYLSRTG